MANNLLGALSDGQYRQDVANALLDASWRGGVGGLLGAPVDAANGVANALRMGYGYLGNKAGLLSADQMPQPIENPIGGSEWFGNKMQDAGLVTGNRNALAEALASFVAPAAPQKIGAVGSGIENALSRAAINASSGISPVGLNAQVGAVNPKYGWAKSLPDEQRNHAEQLAQMLAEHGVKASNPGLGGGRPYHQGVNGVGGTSTYQYVPNFGDVRFSDHLKPSAASMMDNDYSNAADAFSAIKDKFSLVDAKSREIAALRNQINLPGDSTGNRAALEAYINANQLTGQKRDLGYWKDILDLGSGRGGDFSSNTLFFNPIK